MAQSAIPSSVGGTMGVALVMMCFIGMAAFHAWLAISTWGDPDRFGRTASLLSFRVGEFVGRGLARGVAVVAGASLCLACFMLSALAGMASPAPGVWKWISVCLLAGYLAAVPLLAVIVAFNRPRFLVVPYMRHLDRTAIRGGSLSLRERVSRARRSGRLHSSS